MIPFEHQGRRIELEVEVPGDPDEVFRAIATGPGIGSWFIPMEVEERSGGEVVMDWGSYGKQTAKVVAFEPPSRVVFADGSDGSGMAFEWLVETRDGATFVRLVNSGFGEGDEWDAQFDGMSEGWKIFMANLRLRLTHFAGRTSKTMIPAAAVGAANAEAWESLCGALGIPTDAEPGDVVETTGDSPKLAGRVESKVVLPAVRSYLLHLSEPTGTGFVAVEGGEKSAASVYLYLYDDVADDYSDQWQKWMAANIGEAEVIS